MSYLVDPDDLAQDTELKLLELQEERGYSNDVISSLPFRRTVGKYVRLTTQQYYKARRLGTNQQDNIDDHVSQEHYTCTALIDTSMNRATDAWCTLVDLPKEILRIGYKRMSGYPITTTEWNRLRQFRKRYAKQEEAHESRYI